MNECGKIHELDNLDYMGNIGDIDVLECEECNVMNDDFEVVIMVMNDTVIGLRSFTKQEAAVNRILLDKIKEENESE